MVRERDGKALLVKLMEEQSCWIYDFVHMWIYSGHGFRMLAVPDEDTREFLA